MFQPNQRIGEYVLEELVTENSYAQEWRAHHHMWSDQLALVKIATDPQYVNSLRTEGVRVHRLVHPNIICPLGFDPAATPPYLITEYVPGDTLRSWISGKRLSVAQSINILRQVLDALQFGHERQVIHGDIRPENILLDSTAAAGDFARGGSVKVTDFGVGAAASAALTHDDIAQKQNQGAALIYIAPERRNGDLADVKSDIYSVGVVLFEMLTGEAPSGAELPSELNPQVPPWLDDVFRKSYARRERRFDSAKAFADALAAPVASPVPAAPKQPEISLQNEIKFRETGHTASQPAAPAAPEVESEISLASDDEPAISPVEEAPEDVDLATAEEQADAPPADEEELEEQQEVGADTSTFVTDQTSNEPVFPQISRVSSPADRNALFDELNKRQVRTPDDLRAALKGYFELRDLDQGESANIRLRLLKWAGALSGGNAELDDQIALINAAARPLYVVTLLLRSTRGDEPARSQTLEHPIGEQAGTALRSGDYRLIAHFSADALNEKLLETIASTPLRTAIINLSTETRREFFGRIQREDLLIFRANIITAAYRYEQKKYRTFMVGNSLGVVSAGEPFTRIRQEPTKRAASLLNGEQIHQGMKELRRALDDPRWESKANVILGAYRGKLAAAYLVEADNKFKSFEWLESMEEGAKAGQLVPGSEAALDHAARVRRRIIQLQLFPGTLIALVLVGLSVMWSFQQVKPLELKPVLIQLVQSSLFVAGIAAWIATLWSNAVLRARMARTDFAFYQAAVFPLLVALSIAFVKYTSITSDVVCGVLLIAVIFADVMVFKKFRRRIFRPIEDWGMVGDGLTVLNRIESLMVEDWERIRPHYLELGPLFSFTSVQVAHSAAADMMDEPSDASPGYGSDDTVGGTVHGGMMGDGEESEATGNDEVDKLVQQMNARISANLRVLAPAARMVLTIFGEYSKAVSSHQLGMMQANALRLEQKGKDLAAKLLEFDRLCRAPLTLETGGASDLLRDAGRRIAQRAESSDIRLLQTLADRSKNFREDQTAAAAEIGELVPQVEAAVERLKKS